MRSSMFVLLFTLLLPNISSAQIIKVGGSSTVQAFVALAADSYRRLHPQVKIDVTEGGSAVGFEEVVAGRLHIGMMSREPNPDELRRMGSIERIAVGIDAVAVVLPDAIFHGSHLHALKREDIAAIYRGEISNWKAVGGPDRRILVVEKERQRGTRHVFAEYMLGDALAPLWSQAVVVGPNRHMSALLLASDQAIGFLPFGEMNERIHGIEIIDGGKAYAPIVSGVEKGSYPMARKLWLLVPEDAPAYVKSFVEFLRSDQVKPLLRKAGYLPLQ